MYTFKRTKTFSCACPVGVNLYPISAAYMRQLNVSLVQVMACRLLSAKPLT